MAQAAFMEQTFPQLTDESQQDVLDYLAANPNAFADAIANGTAILGNLGDQTIFLGTLPVKFDVPEIPECEMATVVDPSTLGCTLNASKTGFNCPQGSGGGEIPPGSCDGNPITMADGETTVTFSTNFDNDAGIKYKIDNGSKVSLSSVNSRDSGGKAMLFEVGSPQLTPEQCSDDQYRAELVPSGGVNQIPWDDGVDYWTGASFNPQDFKGDASTLFQIHAPNEENGSECDYAGNSFTIEPELINDQMHYVVRVIENGGQSSGTGAGSNTTQVWSTPMVEGEWADFVVNFTLSTENKGYFQVWYNGQLVYQKSGLTNVNHIDSCGKPVPDSLRASNGPHIGIYGPPCGGAPWQQEAAGPNHYRSILIDELRVATGPDGYAAVDPSNGSNPVSNTCQ